MTREGAGLGEGKDGSLGERATYQETKLADEQQGSDWVSKICRSCTRDPKGTFGMLAREASLASRTAGRQSCLGWMYCWEGGVRLRGEC
jgi:hypothetical protein